MTNIFIRKGDTKKGRLCEEESRDELCSHKPRKVQSPQKLEAAGEDSPRATGEARLSGWADTLILDFWPPELWKNKFLFQAKYVILYYSSPR